MKRISRLVKADKSDLVMRYLFLRKGLTVKPRRSDSVVSDLFIVREDENWKTEFEVLNINAIIAGDFGNFTGRNLKFHFFTAKGRKVKTYEMKFDERPRQTVQLSNLISGLDSPPATFAVEHPNCLSVDDLEGSHVADRGYTGYEFKNLGVKGYVHGNLDAVEIHGERVSPIGNSGFFQRYYTVQHVLKGPAIYEFAFTNPTSKVQVIQPQLTFCDGLWLDREAFAIESLGASIFRVEIQVEQKAIARFRSKLYLARPVVFRSTDTNMDVFHG